MGLTESPASTCRNLSNEGQNEAGDHHMRQSVDGRASHRCSRGHGQQSPVQFGRS
jgi:hypothetical protein